MLTVEEARSILGESCPLTDEEVQLLLDVLSHLAQNILDGATQPQGHTDTDSSEGLGSVT